jgi:hypothetical protein
MTGNESPSHNFLDSTTIGTMGAAAAGVFAVCVLVRKVFKVNHPAVPAVTSMLISFGLAGSNGTLNTFLGWIIAALNGCLLFCAAVGANETATDFVTPKPVGKGQVQ